MGFIIKWTGGTAYVGDTGRVEGVDGDIWPLQKPLWILRRMLKNRGLDFTIEERDLSLVNNVDSKQRGQGCKNNSLGGDRNETKRVNKKPKRSEVVQLKEIEEPLEKEPVECKS